MLEFKSVSPYTLGVELELQVINPHTQDLTRGGPDLLRALEKVAHPGEIKPEITESMIELNSSPHARHDSLLEELHAMRDAVVHTAGSLNLAIAGGGGGRLDHLVAILRLFERGDPPREWHTQRESSFFLAAGAMAGFSAAAGSLVSVFPLGGEICEGMESRGLRWPLEGLVWKRGDFGVSNRSLGPTFELRAGSTPLLVMLPLGGELLA